MPFQTRPPLRTATGVALAFAAIAATLAGCGKLPLPGQAAGPRDLGKVSAASFKGSKPAVVGVHFSNKKQVAKLVDQGLEVWYIDEQTKTAYGQIDRPSFQGVESTTPGLDMRLVSAPGIYNEFDKGYHTYDALKSEMAGLASRNGEIAKLVDIGDGFEKTQGRSDRDILAIHIGKGDVSKKPAVLFVGNHHAREIVTPEIVLKVAQMLTEGYGKDPDITNFVENRDIWLVPMVNPDGHKLAAEGNDWRKNVNPTNGGGLFDIGPNGAGVDLNRNYGFKWGGPGASADPRSATFRGAGAFSEPETQAIKGLVETRKWQFLMTYHSFSNLILWPWGHTDAPPPDKRIAPIGMELGKLSGYKPQQSVQLYPTSGDTTDWAFGTHGILSYTTEIGSWSDGFDPSYSKLPGFWKQNEPGARLLLKLADNPAHVFGPAIGEVAVRGGQVQVQVPAGAVEIESFAGTAGADGTGAKAPVSGGRATVAAPARGGNGLVLVHARDAKGNWGPLQAAFNK